MSTPCYYIFSFFQTTKEIIHSRIHQIYKFLIFGIQLMVWKKGRNLDVSVFALSAKIYADRHIKLLFAVVDHYRQYCVGLIQDVHPGLRVDIAINDFDIRIFDEPVVHLRLQI